MKRSIFLFSGLVFISSALLVFLASGVSLAKGTDAEKSPYGDRPEEISVDNAYRPPMVYADAVDLKAVTNGRVEGAFDIINDTDETVSDLGYRIEVYGDPLGEEGGNDPQVLFGRLQSDDVLALTAKERKNVSFAFDLPSLPKGAYTAQVQILQTGGRKLGWGRTPLVLNAGTSNFVYLYEASIVLPEFENREVHPLTGPNVDPEGALMFTAKVEHASSANKTVVPTIEWHEFDESRPVTKTESFDAVTVKPGELSLLTLPVKAPAKPGVYVGSLTLRDGNAVVSTIGQYRIVVRGVSADLISARLASVATKKGETAFARIDYVGSADAETRVTGQLTVELRDADGVAGSLSVPEIRLTDGVGRGTARIELTRDLTSEPNLHVVIGDAQGNVLRDATVPVSLSAEQIDSIKAKSDFFLWASWYAQPYYLMFAFVTLTVLVCLAFIIRVAVKNAFNTTKAFQSVSAAVLVGVLLFMQSPFAMAFGGSNGIEVFAPITVGENENYTSQDRNAYRAYWGEIYAQPTVALFVNRPVHNSTYQCNTPIPFEYRIDFAACNNMPSGGRVLAHFDQSQQHQSSLLGSGANWIKVYDQVYNQPANCSTHACIHSYSQNTTLDLFAAGLPANATKTTLRVVVKHNPYLDGGVAFPNDQVSLSDFYFSRRVVQAFNIWLNFVCAQPKADIQITKTAVTPSVDRGNQASYGITVRNNGPDTANNVVVTDQIPNGLTFVSSSDSRCSQVGSSIVCNFGNMTNGSQISATFTFQTSVATVCGNVPNTALVTTTTQDDNQSNNSSTATIQVNCPVVNGCIDVIKEAYDPNGNVISVVPQFTFTLDGSATVTNDANGNARFTNVTPGSHTVTETLPSGWQQILVTPVNGTVSVPSGNQCATVVFKNRQVLQPNPDVSIVKSGPSSVNPGNSISYTLTVSNVSTVAANNVSIVDHVPAGLTFLPSSSDPACSQQSASIACNLGTLGAGSSRSVVLSFSVPSTQPCTTINNQATVSATNDSNASNNTSNTVTTQVNCQVQTGCIEITKTTLNTRGSILTPVAQFTFTLDGNQSTVNDSTGKARFNNVSVGTHTVSEIVPSGWTMTSMTPANGIVNVTASANNTSCAQVTVLNQQNSVQVNADMAIVKTGPSSVARGTNFTYQLQVTNNGPQTAQNVVVVDTVPSELIVLPGSTDSRCTVSGQTVTCNLGSMTSGQQTSITVGVTTSAPGTNCSQATVTNRATVTSSTPDSNQSNNSSQMNTTLTCPNVQTFCPDVSIDVDDDEVDAGDEIEFEIRVRNNTNQSQTFDLTAFLDKDMEFVDANGGGDDDDDEVEWNNVFIGANDTKVLDLVVEVDSDLNDGDSVRLRVETDCDSDSQEVDIRGERIARGEPNLTIDKSVDRNEALPGDVLAYTLVVRNSGSAAIDDVVVDDIHTSNRLTIFSAPGGQIRGNAIHWDLGRMEVGAVRTLHYTASVSLDAQNGDLIPNTATVTAPGQRASDSEFVRVIRVLPQTGSPVLPLAASVVFITGSLGATFFSKRYFF